MISQDHTQINSHSNNAQIDEDGEGDIDFGDDDDGGNHLDYEQILAAAAQELNAQITAAGENAEE